MRFALALIVLVACTPFAKADMATLAAGLLAVHTSPQPQPQPSNICTNCNGTGRLGDGTISLRCDPCGGTGRITTASHVCACDDCDCDPCLCGVVQVSKQLTMRRGYPTRGALWGGAYDWRHLTHGQHAGKFDHAWLQTLSNAELQSLHSDDHEDRVKWEYVVRQTKQPAAAPQKRASQSCANGSCGTAAMSRRPLFNLFRR